MLRINRVSFCAKLISRKCSNNKTTSVLFRSFSTVDNNANNSQNSPSNAAHRASFLSPKDFLDANSPALNSLPKETTTHVNETIVGPASIKLGVQLTKYGVNLTKLAQEGKLESVIGREKEFQQVVQVLSRRRKSNPVLIGEPGVGKSSIVEGLANLIAKGLVPESMKDKVIISLDLASMLAGTKFRGEFEERLKGVMKEIELAGDRIILFIDEIHSLCGAGGSEGAIDASNILKPALARGHLKVLGTTTVEEYSRYIEKDAALARRFQAVYVNEPSQEETMQILRGLKLKYENHHKVIIPEETISTAVRLAARYYPSKRFPDKAIDLIDEAASRLRNRNESVPMRITSIEKEIERVQSKIDHAIISFQDISKLDEEELIKLQEERGKIYKAWRDQNQMVNLIFETQANTIRLKEELKTKRATNENKEMLSRLAENIRTNDKTISDLYSSLNSSNLDSSSALSLSHNSNENKTPGSVAFRNTLEEKDVAEIIAVETGIPLDSMLVKENSSSLVSMEDDLKEQIIGQDNAIKTIAKCIRLSKAGLRFHDRPIGVFLFLGPTGVGKTELAKVVNGILFKDQPTASNILRIDMSEYMERFSVSRLIGSPPGYVGFEEGGILTDAIRRRPYQLVLLDEFEKAHREVSNLLLQVFDEGRLTDSQGRTVDFRNTVIILTSNLGSDILAKYASEEDPDAPKPDANGNKLESRQLVATKIVHQHFSPEFVNRLDDVIVFNALNQDAIMKICSIQLKKVKQLFEEKRVRFSFTKQAAETIASSGTNLQYGARPLKRLIQNEVLSPLATKILSGDLREGDELHLIAEEESIDSLGSLPGKTMLPFNLEFNSTSSTDTSASNTDSNQETKQIKRIVKAIVLRPNVVPSST